MSHRTWNNILAGINIGCVVIDLYLGMYSWAFFSGAVATLLLAINHYRAKHDL